MSVSGETSEQSIISCEAYCLNLIQYLVDGANNKLSLSIVVVIFFVVIF